MCRAAQHYPPGFSWAFRLFENGNSYFQISDLHYLNGNGRKARVRF